MPHPTARPSPWTLARIAAAGVVLAAVIAQAFSTIGDAVTDGRDVVTTTANFFSYFTILSNLATVALLAWAGFRRIPRSRRGAPDPRGYTTAFVAVVTYMLITGAVYNLLLRATSIGPDTVGWANEVMHVVAPLFLLVDLVWGDGHRMPRWSTAPLAVVFPLAWIIYTLLRAPLITAPFSGEPFWYPYPFLNPSGPGGWPSVAAYIVAIAIGIVGAAFAVVAVLRVRGRRGVTRAGARTPAR